MSRTEDLRHAVQGYYAALDRDDLDAVYELFAGDVLYRRPGYDAISGMEELRGYYGGERRLDVGRHLVRDILVEEGRAAAHGTYEGKTKDGTRMTIGFGAFFVFDAHGRIAEHTTYFFTPVNA